MKHFAGWSMVSNNTLQWVFSALSFDRSALIRASLIFSGGSELIRREHLPGKVKSEPDKILRRTKAARCLQSCGGLRGCGLAADSGGLDLVPDLRRACLGHENFRNRYRSLFPRRVGFLLGFRDHSGRDQTGIGYRPRQIEYHPNRPKNRERNRG